MSETSEVLRIETPTGSHIEPPLDPTWTDEEKLTWHAAVTAVDTGLDVRIQRAGYSHKVGGFWRPVRGDWFNIQTGSSCAGPFNFDSAWTYLNGIAAGVQAIRRADQ